MTQHPLADALRALVERLDLVHNDPAFRSVWETNQLYRGPYTGPQYATELADAREALSQYEKSDTGRDQLREGARRAYEMIGNLEMEIGHPMETDFTQLHADLWKALASKTAIDPVTVVDAVKSVKREWFCSGEDCTPYDHGRDEGLQLAEDAAIRALGKDQ